MENFILIGLGLLILHKIHIYKVEEREQKERIKEHGEFLKAIKKARSKYD